MDCPGCDLAADSVVGIRFTQIVSTQWRAKLWWSIMNFYREFMLVMLAFVIGEET
jgi:hypothetical protein